MFCSQIGGGKRPQWRGLVYPDGYLVTKAELRLRDKPMRENHRPVHLEEVLRPIQVGAESDSKEMVGNSLALLSPGLPHHIG